MNLCARGGVTAHIAYLTCIQQPSLPSFPPATSLLIWAAAVVTTFPCRVSLPMPQPTNLIVYAALIPSHFSSTMAEEEKTQFPPRVRQGQGVRAFYRNNFCHLPYGFMVATTDGFCQRLADDMTYPFCMVVYISGGGTAWTLHLLLDCIRRTTWRTTTHFVRSL